MARILFVSVQCNMYICFPQMAVNIHDCVCKYMLNVYTCRLYIIVSFICFKTINLSTSMLLG